MAATFRRSRNSIPKVNQNPRPPGEHRRAVLRQYGIPRSVIDQMPKSYRGSLTQKIHKIEDRKANAMGSPVKPYQPTGSLDPTQLQQQFSQTTNPADLFKFSSYTPQQGETDPRDAEYWSNVTKLLSTAQQGYNSDLLQQQYSDTDYATATQDLQRQQGIDQRSLAENAMRKGLGLSGYLDRGTAEQTTEYLRGFEDLGTNKQRQDIAAETARNAILQGFSVDEAGALAEAAARQADQMSKQAQTGAPEMNPKEVNRIGKVISRQLGLRRKGHNKKHH